MDYRADRRTVTAARPNRRTDCAILRYKRVSIARRKNESPASAAARDPTALADRGCSAGAFVVCAFTGYPCPDLVRKRVLCLQVRNF
jgi:hypothetical protein